MLKMKWDAANERGDEEVKSEGMIDEACRSQRRRRTILWVREEGCELIKE